jgi:lipopolysaccharide export system protein LptA
MKHLLLSLLLLLSLPLAADDASAATPDKPAPITIEADRLELDQKRGSSHYQGNVLLQQGGLQIKADSITLHTVNKKLHRAVAKGQPATLLQLGETPESAMRAEALLMEYHPQSERVELSGKARLWRNGNEFSGEQISYDLKQQLVKASGSEQGNGRVRVLLQPESDTPPSEESP